MRNWPVGRSAMAELSDQPSLRERLGGRWAISWQAYVITAPVAVIAPVAFARNPTEVLPWMLIGAISFMVVGAWTYLMHRTLFRNRLNTPVALGWLVVNAIVVATLYVGVAVSLGFLVGISDVTHFVPSPIPTAVFATGWSTVLILVLESQGRFHAQREELIEQAVQQQLTSLQELEVLDQIRSAMRTEVGDELAVARQRLEGRIDSLVGEGEIELAAVAEELRETADTTVRSLSHRLADRTERRSPRPRLLTAVRNIARYQPFRPLAVSALYVVVALPGELARNGFPRALLTASITIALIFATMSVANMVMRRWPEHHSALFIAGIAFVQMPTIAFALLSESATGVQVAWIDLVVTVTLGALVIVLTSAFGSWNRTRQDVIRQFAQEVHDDEIAALARGAAVAQIAHEAAMVLHGSLQSQLRACALVVHNASAKGDIIEVNRALVQARAILENPVPALTRDFDASLDSVVMRKANEWAGLVDVQVHLDSEAARNSGAFATHVGDVVEEGIANAFHHGSASKVSVTIVGESNDLIITVRDNGRGPGGGTPGLGSRLFSRFGGQWELIHQDSGSLLTVRLEHAPTPSAR
jgi:hypothetical protein